MLPLAANGADVSTPALPPAPAPAALQAPRFRLFPELSLSSLRFGDLVRSPEKVSIRQAGDPDSVISPGAPSPTNELKLIPAFEINDILLKAYSPDANLDPHDNRFRAAGAFSPLDHAGRPYQLRLGARLVW
jgi:hypothetical protein